MGKPAVPEFKGPPLVERLTRQLAAQGHVKDPTAMALALLKARGHVNDEGDLTAAGRARDALGAEGRAKDRAATRSGRPATDFKYSAKSNQATLKANKAWGR